MDQLLQKVKAFFIDCTERVSDFIKNSWEDNRPLFIACSSLGFLLIVLLILLAVGGSGKTDSKPVLVEFSEEPVTIQEYLYMPEEPSIPEEYVFSRENVNRWSDETVNRWFSEPDVEMLEELKNANDKAINDMLEVVP